MIEELVLGILSKEDMAGYTIKKLIEKNFAIFCKISFGSLHPALKRLEAKGMVSNCVSLQGERKSIIYHITDAGKSSFTVWLTSPMNVMDGTNCNLAKICFFDSLPLETKNEQVQKYLDSNVKYLAELMEMRKSLSALGLSDKCYYKLSTLYYGICVTEQTIEWCRHILSKKPLDELLKGAD